MPARGHEMVVCEGEWDIARAGEFARRAALGLASGAAVVILDFRPATFVDAGTVGAIFAIARTAPARGVKLAVTCGPGAVRRVFELAHLPEVVPLAETVEEALRSVRA